MLPIKVLCHVVYFDFFCSKLTSAIEDRTLYKSKQTEQSRTKPVPVKAEVQVTSMAVYFTVEICFVLTCMGALVITES